MTDAVKNDLQFASTSQTASKLDNLLIIKAICNFLDFDDLLNLSLVSRSWRAGCRWCLRARTCIISLHRVNTDVCHHLKSIDELLKASVDVPFSGFCTGRFLQHRLPCAPEQCLTNSGHEGVRKQFSVLLERVSFKFLRIGHSAEVCPPIRNFLQKILGEKSSRDLVELEIVPYYTNTGFDELQVSLWNDATNEPKYKFPRLKTIVLPYTAGYGAAELLEETDIIKSTRALFLSAPNLKSTHGLDFQNSNIRTYLDHFLIHKFSTIKEFYPSYQLGLNHVEALLNQMPALQMVEMHNWSYWNGFNELHKRFWRLIIQSSCKSLTSIALEIEVLLWISTKVTGFGLLNTFPNLRCIKTSAAGVQNKYLHIVNWDLLFPKLEVVSLFVTNYSLDHSCPLTADIFDVLDSSDRKFRSESVTGFSYNCCPIENLELEWIQNLFPNVQTLAVNSRADDVFVGLRDPLSSATWKHLHTLSFNSIECRRPDYLSYWVFGYYLEELELYENRDEEFWRSLHLMPCTSSIFCTPVKRFTLGLLLGPDKRLKDAFPPPLVQFIKAKFPGLTIIFFETVQSTSRVPALPAQLIDFPSKEISCKKFDKHSLANKVLLDYESLWDVFAVLPTAVREWQITF